MESRDWDAVVIGGGFFGTYLAFELKRRLRKVVVLERARDLLTRASYNNQARVHAGYHYPRSLMTAVRSRVNFPRFVEDFRDAIKSDFEKYYAVGRHGSKVTADQFALFMQRAGVSLSPAPERISRMFNSDLVEAVFTAREYVFDAAILRRIMRRRLEAAGITIQFGISAERVRSGGLRRIELGARQNNQMFDLSTDWVFNCTYSGINRLCHASGLPLIPLKHELAEIALVDVPPALKLISVTMMCGPYFSLVPFPDRALWTLSHVRYTPHQSWHDSTPKSYRDSGAHFDLERAVKVTNAPLMIRDAARYLPVMAGCVHRDSLWEVKTVLPQSELDDGRPILFHYSAEQPGLAMVLGGKLDNVYDLAQELDAAGIGTRRSAAL